MENSANIGKLSRLNIFSLFIGDLDVILISSSFMMLDVVDGEVKECVKSQKRANAQNQRSPNLSRGLQFCLFLLSTVLLSFRGMFH